ncbi:NAD(P)H-dependent oxidoreductase [Isobaculum melis]|uniref:FMN dependent NADH:quinone oxidoreductase n=1 Tax=Isobaculum melis TaxID=142588 RepID=A0A1H9SW50_9LACT|nr:FMN-dependent NADH-azoreductase [Isobaculum melis]SER89135.1 FMN-dependent NADH-azoreductase [Isobaculum melis]
MSKVLVVKAHPLTGEASNSIRVADAFITAYKETNHFDHIEELSLYTSFIPEIDEEILMAWGMLANGESFEKLSQSQQDKVSRFNELTEKFLDADKIVIANPLWNLSIPTRLKAWIDTVVVSGTSFKYTAEGPVGLIKGKKLLHIQSNGGIYKEQDPASQYIKTIFGFIGVVDQQQVFLEGVNYDPSQTESIVLEGIQKAVKIAQTF